MGLGGDMTAAYEAEEWAQAHKEGKKMTTSCCPAFVNMIKQHFPMLSLIHIYPPSTREIPINAIKSKETCFFIVLQLLS